MEPTNHCPSCGQALAPNAPMGLCPACLMKAGFPTGTQVAPGGAAPAKSIPFIPPTPAQLAPLFPQLEIIELIGQGGMGAVYKARQPALDRLVALKILPPQTGDDPGFAERFAREARALARLSHPSIVAVHDHGQSGGFHYFIMEYVDGANLRQIERAGKLAPHEALQIIPQICEALQFAHDAGIVHRDIKPENILLDKKGRVKIADFGLAKIFGADSERRDAITEHGHVMGTPHYMAPEQIEHPLEVDHRADIFSLGVVFYEMLTGELPLGKFAAPSQKVQIDVRLDEVVLRALEKEPQQRYQHASQVRTAVETIAAGPGNIAATVDAGRESAVTMHAPSSKQGRWLWVAALLLALAFLAGDGAVRMHGITEISASKVGNTPPIAEDPNSLSGYQFNQHQLVYPALGTDGYHSVMQTELMAGDLRGKDAAPAGENASPLNPDVHWSSSLHWPLLALAWLYSQCTGQSAALGIGRLAPWTNTLMLAVLLLVMVPRIARRFGPWPAALLGLGAATTYPFYEYFFVGDFTPNALSAVCHLLTVLFIVMGGAGWVRTPLANAGRLSSEEKLLRDWLLELPQARRWFLASGIAGGIGLWFNRDTASMLPTLLALGVGAVLGAGWLGRGLSASSPWRIEPALWRRWGWAGALTSLVLYFLDYAPSNFGQRAEVILHAVVFAGAGDLLCRLCRWLSRGRLSDTPAQTRREAGLLVLDVVMVTLPFSIAFLTAKYDLLTVDPFWRMLHDDYILEDRSTWGQILSLSPFQDLYIVNLLPLAVIPVALISFSRTLLRPWKALLVMTLIPALAMLGLASWQIRWLGVDCGVSLVMLTTLALVTTRSGPGFRWTILRKIGAAVFLALVLLPFPAFSIYMWVKLNFSPMINPLDLSQVITRDVSYRLRERLGAEPGLIVSGPTTTTWMMYFGGFQGLGILYQEDIDGLKATAAIYSADSPEKARALMEKYHVTHIVIYSFDSFYDAYARLAHGLRKDEPAPDNAFMRNVITHQAIPTWLRPIPYDLPNDERLKGQYAFILEYVPEDQTKEEAQIHISQWLLANGKTADAESSVNSVLEQKPDYLPALIQLGLIQVQQGQADAVSATLKKIADHFDQAEKLPLEERVDLGFLFYHTSQNASAADQLRTALASADEKGMRRLSPERLRAFHELAVKLNLLDDHPDAFKPVEDLLPVEPQMKPAIKP